MSLSRRELLSALLGAPLASLACSRKSRPVAGSLLGARLEIGHRLLDLSVERVSAPAERVSVLIVGSGPSGLAAAWRLERLGVRDYRVLDLEGLVGGTSASGHDGVVPYPWGAHYVPVPRREQHELVTLLEELGAVRVDAAGTAHGVEAARVRAPEERLFIDGHWIEGLFPASRANVGDRAELARFEAEVQKWVDFRDSSGRRAFTLPMRRCSDAAEPVALDRLSARGWLDQHGFRSPLLRWYVEYACRDDYGASLEHTSAWAMLFYFCARASDAGGETAPFLTWPEGNGRVVAHLARGLGERLQLNRLVTDVVPGPDSVEVVAYDAVQKRALRYLADDVILAVPKLVARRIVRLLRDAPPPHLSEFHYGAWLVANLHLSERPRSRGFPFAWDNVLFDSPALGYVVATHQTLADFGPTVWTYYRPFWEHGEKESRALLRSLDHATAVDGILTDLGRAHQGLEPLVERIDVYRWGHAMVTPLPGFIWGGARAKASEPLGRVVFAHSDLSGIALLEEAFDRGLQAADAVLARRGASLPDRG
ncbi:MAG TPA: FAD-dependent oxidoreductase [Polyangiaceae bacterium]|nr:FAD-dependent oxidoreductase [Polyangiaceae bacterium]